MTDQLAEGTDGAAPPAATAHEEQRYIEALKGENLLLLQALAELRLAALSFHNHAERLMRDILGEVPTYDREVADAATDHQ